MFLGYNAAKPTHNLQASQSLDESVTKDSYKGSQQWLKTGVWEGGGCYLVLGWGEGVGGRVAQTVGTVCAKAL